MPSVAGILIVNDNFEIFEWNQPKVASLHLFLRPLPREA